jgi:hypothetical protein
MSGRVGREPQVIAREGQGQGQQVAPAAAASAPVPCGVGLPLRVVQSTSTVRVLVKLAITSLPGTGKIKCTRHSRCRPEF